MWLNVNYNNTLNNNNINNKYYVLIIFDLLTWPLQDIIILHLIQYYDQ